MAERRFLNVDALRELDSSGTTISSSYISIGAALSSDPVSVCITNETAAAIYVSLDSGTTTHGRIQANSFMTFSGNSVGDFLATAKGNIVKVKRGGGSDITSGIVSVIALYGG